VNKVTVVGFMGADRPLRTALALNEVAPDN